MDIKLEPALGIFDEIRGLLRLHWEEIALDKSAIQLAPRWEEYETLARSGILQTITVRDAGMLVGYAAFFVTPHLHYRDSLTAVSDIFFIKKEYRQGLTGVRLFKVAEHELRKLGVQKMYVSCKLHLDLGPIFERLGFKPIERTYAKLIS